jgi:hypothetical protein
MHLLETVRDVVVILAAVVTVVHTIRKEVRDTEAERRRKDDTP